MKKNQKGGVFKRNSSRGHELRIFVDGDPDNVVDFFEEYEGFKRGYPRRRSVYYLPDKESAIEPLIPEFIHISQSIQHPHECHSTLETNPFNIGWSDFLRANFTQREIARYCPVNKGPGKIRCHILTDRNGRQLTEYSFHSHPMSKKKLLRLLLAWSNQSGNYQRIRPYLPTDKSTPKVLLGFARYLLRSLKYALLVFQAEKATLLRLENATRKRNQREYNDAIRRLNQSYYNFKVEWYTQDYLSSPKYLASEKYPNAEGLTSEQEKALQTRWRDEQYHQLPYPEVRRIFRR